MGAYRFILAFLVVFGHLRASVYGFNTGAIAVVSFLLLSGFVMTPLIEKHYWSTALIPNFYLDRFLRLAPQFYLYSALTLVGALIFGLHHNWMAEPPSLVHSILQLLVFPLDFYRYFPSMLLPQGWSLGLEAMFYVVFPFILLLRIRFVIFLVSFFIFISAYFGIIDTDLYAYRYLPGVLFIFITGSYLQNAADRLEKAVPVVVFCLSLCFFVLTYIESQIFSEQTLSTSRNVLGGVMIGIPAIYFLTNAKSQSPISNLAGDLSYGIFLNHWLIIACILTFTDIEFTRLSFFMKSAIFLVICIVSTALSYVSFNFVEKPFLAWRRHLRTHRANYGLGEPGATGTSLVRPSKRKPASSSRLKATS